MTKKIIITLVIVLVLISIGLILWNIFSQPAGERGEVSLRDFFPFGRSPKESGLSSDISSQTNGNSEISTAPESISRLRKISENPVAGGTAWNSQGKMMIRFVDRATGHIFETNDTTLEIRRVSNTTIPKIHEAVWTSSDSVILRYLRENEETIETVILKLKEKENIEGIFDFKTNLKQGDTGIAVKELQKFLNMDPDTKVANQGPGSPGNETTIFGPATSAAVRKFQGKYSEEILAPQDLSEPTGELDELTREKLNQLTGAATVALDEEDLLLETTLTFLPTEIKNLIFLPDTQKIFYLQEDELGTVGTLANADGTKTKQIFQSSAREWLAQPVNGSEISLVTKASFNSPGLLFSLNSANGALKKLIGGVSGFTALVSPKSNKILFSESNRGGFNLKISIDNKFYLLPINLNTLPEKCLWSRSADDAFYCAVPQNITNDNYPDAWYKGVVSFNDQLMKLTANERNISSEVLTDSASLRNSGNDLDAIALFTDQEEKYLFFQNKNDYSLWSLEL